MDRNRLTLPMVVALGFSGAFTGWLGWRHIGPYRWLAEAEANAFGGHYHPQIIWLLLFLVVAGPLTLVARAIPVGHQFDFSRVMAYWGMYPRHAQLTIVCATCLVLGVGQLARTSLAGSLVDISLAAFEAAEVPPTFVRLHDFGVDGDNAIEVSSSRIYVPLRVTDGPIVLLAEVNREELEGLAPGDTIEGLVEADGLPNEVRVLYEDEQMLADPYYVVEVGSSPEHERRFALYLLGFASVLAAVLAVYYFGTIRGSF